MAQKYIREEYPDGSVVLSNIRKKRGTIPVFGMNETYTATKVTQWYDGTAMTPEKADGSVYLRLKETGEYFLVNLPKFGETFLDKDTMVQMRGLSAAETLLLKMGYYKGVRLHGYHTKGDTPAPIEYYISETTEEDDGGSVFEVGGIKLEHEFVGRVDVRYFGIFDNYVGNPFFNRIKYPNVWVERGTYTITSSDIIDIPAINIESNGAVIQADGDFSKDDSIMIYVSNATVRCQLSGLVFDGQNQVSECMRILNSENGNDTVSIIKIDGVEFRNTVKNSEIGAQSTNSAPLYIRGSFLNVLVENSSFYNSESDGNISGASRGLLITQNNNETTWTHNAIIRGCRFGNIKRTNITSGAMDADCIFMSNYYSTPYLQEETERSSLIVENCSFKDFSGRAVKSQVGDTIITNNKVVCYTVDFQVIFDFQRNQGVAYGNNILIDNVSGTVFNCFRYDEVFKQSHSIFGNQVEVIDSPDVIFLSTGCSTSSSGTYTTPIYGVSVQNNQVSGEIGYFINARLQSRTSTNHITVTNNSVDSVKNFIRTWRVGFTSSKGLLNLIFSNNHLSDYRGENPIWEQFQGSLIYFNSFDSNVGFEGDYSPNTYRIATADYSGGSEEVYDGVNVGEYISDAAGFFRGRKGIIILKSGEYILNRSGYAAAVDIPENISVEGDGDVMINVTSANNHAIRVNKTSESIHTYIKNIRVKSLSSSQGIISGNFYNFTVDSCTIEGGLTANGVNQSASGGNFTIKDCESFNCLNGLMINPRFNVKVINSVFRNNSNNGIYSYSGATSSKNVHIYNNTIIDNDNHGILASGSVGEHLDFVIENNTFENNGGVDIYINERITESKVASNKYTTSTLPESTIKLVNQSSNIEDVISDDGTLTPSSSATDVSEAVSDLNTLIDNYNSLVILVDELKVKLNSKLSADRDSGQQAT